MARILYLSEGYSTHDRRFLEKLAQTPHEVWFLPFGKDPFPYEVRPAPLGIHQLPPLTRGSQGRGLLTWILAAARFIRHTRVIRPDLVHAGPVQSGGFLAALLRRYRLLVMSWGSDVLVIPDKSRFLRWLTSFTLRRAHIVVGDCEAVRQKLFSLAKLKPEQVVVFPFGIELARFQSQRSHLDLRRQFDWEGCPVLISTRSFEPSHGTSIFIEAARRVIERHPTTKVLMLGDGSLRPQVEAFISEHALSGRVRLLGQISHDLLPDYFNEADLYVSATYSDGTSISLLEAMACGLPVVVPDAYGNREWVTPGVNGWLYRPGDSEALTASLCEALENVSLRRAMGKKNRAQVCEKADWERNFNELLKAYNRLLGNTGRKNEEVLDGTVSNR